MACPLGLPDHAAVAAAAGGGALSRSGSFGREPKAAGLFAGLCSASGTLASVPGAILTACSAARDATIAGLVTGGFGTVHADRSRSVGGSAAMFAAEAAAALLGDPRLDAGCSPAGRFSAVSDEITPARTCGAGASACRLPVDQRAVSPDRVAALEFFFLNHHCANRGDCLLLDSARPLVAAARSACLLRWAGASHPPWRIVARRWGSRADPPRASRALRGCSLIVTTAGIAAATAALGPGGRFALFWGDAHAG